MVDLEHMDVNKYDHSLEQNNGLYRRLSNNDIALSFCLGFENGNRKQFHYSNTMADYNPSVGIILRDHDNVAILHGRHLSELHEYLLVKRVTFITERHQLTFSTDESKPYIDRIEIHYRGDDLESIMAMINSHI